MNNSAQIKKPIEQDFAEYEQLYTASFTTDNVLLAKVYEHVLSTKGKQIRPVLTLLAAKLCGQITHSTHLSALCLELLHTASLIHDDVVDNTPERRGKPSVNAEFTNKIAVLSGDHLLSQVFFYAGRIKDERIIDAFSVLGKALSEGELLQLTNANNPQFDEQKYIEIITKKTAILFATCMLAGACSSATATNEEIERLRLFGEYLGLCFQIKDDIFDYIGTKNIGKPTANDIREKKITLPLIYAYNQASTNEQTKIKSLITQPELNSEAIDFLISFAINNGGIVYAEQCMNNYAKQATTLLNDFSDKETAAALTAALDYVIRREK